MSERSDWFERYTQMTQANVSAIRMFDDGISIAEIADAIGRSKNRVYQIIYCADRYFGDKKRIVKDFTVASHVVPDATLIDDIAMSPQVRNALTGVVLTVGEFRAALASGDLFYVNNFGYKGLFQVCQSTGTAFPDDAKKSFRRAATQYWARAATMSKRP